MGFFDKVGSLFKREAKDLGDAVEGVKNTFAQELTKREHELEMTPSQKIAALQQQAATTDARFDAISDKASGKGALADAVAEVGQLPVDVSLPNITHILLPDGRVRSGNDLDQVVDISGAVHHVPVVEAPTVEDLEIFDLPAIADLPVSPVTEPEAVTEDEPPEVDPSSADYGKTPAQLKYEQARTAANILLDELRGELKDDGAT